MTAPTQATAREAVERIEAALAKLPPDADSPWMNLDKMPYIHKTDDPKASPWNCAVVGRFDYLQTMEYILACQPANIRAVLALLAAKQEELDKMREALAGLVDRDFTFFSGQMIGASKPITRDEILAARAALSPSQQGEPR